MTNRGAWSTTINPGIVVSGMSNSATKYNKRAS